MNEIYLKDFIVLIVFHRFFHRYHPTYDNSNIYTVMNVLDKNVATAMAVQQLRRGDIIDEIRVIEIDKMEKVNHVQYNKK